MFLFPTFYALQFARGSQKAPVPGMDFRRCPMKLRSDRSKAAAVYGAMFGYCLALLLVFDFAFSSLTRGDEQKRGSRIADPVYDHGFAAKFDGHEAWGELRCADSASRRHLSRPV